MRSRLRNILIMLAVMLLILLLFVINGSAAWAQGSSSCGPFISTYNLEHPDHLRRRVKVESSCEEIQIFSVNARDPGVRTRFAEWDLHLWQDKEPKLYRYTTRFTNDSGEVAVIRVDGWAMHGESIPTLRDFVTIIPRCSVLITSYISPWAPRSASYKFVIGIDDPVARQAYLLVPVRIDYYADTFYFEPLPANKAAMPECQ